MYILERDGFKTKIFNMYEEEGFMIRHTFGKEYLVLSNNKRPEEALEFMQKKNIRHLELNYSFYPLSHAHYLKDYDFIEGINVLYPEFDTSSFNNLSNLKTLVLQIQIKQKIDFSFFPNLQHCVLDWTPKAKSIFDSKRLKILSIGKFKFDDLSNLKNLMNLEVLNVINSPVKTLDGIEYLQKIESLELSYLRKLTSLKGIEKLHYLKNLEVFTCKKINHINEVALTPSLGRLFLWNCGEIESLKPIEHSSSLKSVDINTKISDNNFTPLEGRNDSKLNYIHKIELPAPEYF